MLDSMTIPHGTDVYVRTSSQLRWVPGVLHCQNGNPAHVLIESGIHVYEDDIFEIVPADKVMLLPHNDTTDILKDIPDGSKVQVQLIDMINWQPGVLFHLKQGYPSVLLDSGRRVNTKEITRLIVVRNPF